MSPPWRCVPTVLVLLLASVPAAAQSPPTLEQVRIGLPAGHGGPETGVTRTGAWAPVAITLRGGKEGNPQGHYRLRIETTDLEDSAFQATVAVPALAGDTIRTVTGYIVPGGDGASFRIQLETLDGKVVHTYPIPSRESTRQPILAAEDILFLGAGAGLSQLKRATEKLDRPDGKEVDADQGRRQFAFAEEVAALPDRWLGYDAVDVVVLATGKRDFVLGLTQESEAPRRNALLEWVRRGGRLIVSVGRNRQEVAGLLERLPLLDVKLTGTEVVGTLPVLSTQWAERLVHQAVLQQVEVATVVPGPGVDVLVRERKHPVILQGACGLGRVVLVAFDLDGPPFTTWEGQEAFWTRLQREVAPPLPARGQARPGAPGGAAGKPAGVNWGESRLRDLRAELKRTGEMFEEVPTISFGWVALFMLVYILLVGPLDYLILKKVFKRLEWTWITFPLTVLVISAAAYLTAYSLKGDELRINKVDLVDLDLHDPRQAQGTSWFTLLSPRVASYTIGLEPAEGWAAPLPEGFPRPVMTLLEVGAPPLRAGTQELFRKPYQYADDASGLVRVPVPVWATRSFTASWRAPVPVEKPPLLITDEVGPLRRARDGRGLVGRITNNLGIALQDVTLIYRERLYTLDRLEPGEAKRVEPLFAADAQGQGRELSGWFTGPALAPGLPLAPTGRPIDATFQQGRTTYRILKDALFFRAAALTDTTNAGLRLLDQTWRLKPLPEYPMPERPRYREEAILVARVPMLCDQAEVVTAHPVSPSRLWIGRLPGEGGERPAVPGYLTQETYLRVFLPVRE